MRSGPARDRPYVSCPTTTSGGLLVRTELPCPWISDAGPVAQGSSVLHLSRERGSSEREGIVYNNA